MHLTVRSIDFLAGRRSVMNTYHKFRLLWLKPCVNEMTFSVFARQSEIFSGSRCNVEDACHESLVCSHDASLFARCQARTTST